MDEGSELRVESALVPFQYRVYPETPMTEVVDLMVRREVAAVPVVNESFEVVGVITAGDALDQVLRTSGGSEDSQESASGMEARDVMTRSVLCVSENQPLDEAARMMVNRDVDQVPVVREGQLIGMLTRDAILRALHPGSSESTEESEESS